ncbi:YtrH family sporulation protein [Pullulanibacillus sp. KACC 23026]|uniref:YtrH family sporulation protein n=1 Tax=Pullulanibacillus sp. KACC 23026 TaxID=3028315 RepID=UPI0023AF94C9|nr:YtrH family sporulation protein [Pullulanibacillus sp. KACC 23026]WEG13897.1 YtrH family sporulation protein [Pullulanibacillus sp. KACC 23026]
MDLKSFFTQAIMYYFIAFGVLIGGSLVGGIAAYLVNRPPLIEITGLAIRLKVWAVVSAMGGSMDALENLERGFLGGTPTEVVKQLLLIVAAMTGAHTATFIVHWITQETR